MVEENASLPAQREKRSSLLADDLGIRRPGEAFSKQITDVLHKYAELLFLVIVLIVIGTVFHWIPDTSKIAFLNFFYLPVLATGYLLGAQRAILASFLCSLLVFVYYLWVWIGASLLTPSGIVGLPAVAFQHWETLLQLAMWSGFLILVGGAFGHVNEHVMNSYEHVQQLNYELHQQADELRGLNTALQSTSKNLTRKAEELQRVSSTMDATVARMIIQGRLREEKRTISVLFCDLKGFTAFSHGRSPEVILEDLNHFYGAMEDVIDAYHGHVDKYMGDGIMCEFGAPIDNQQHALQAVMCGYAMQEKFEKSELPLKLRVGIASGDAVVGLLGSRRRSYTALGEIVNIAKRLEEICEPGTVYLDEKTRELSATFIECDRIRRLGGSRAEDKIILDQIAEKEERLKAGPKNTRVLCEIGKLYYQLQEATHALDYFQRAMELDPEDNEIKVAYAEASVKRDEFEKVSIRGLSQRQSIFQLRTLKNPLLDRTRFSEGFYKRFKHVPDLLEISDEDIHPVEVIGGTLGHSLSVAVVSFALADTLGLSESDKKNILIAARLQDMGKVIIGQHLLNRRGGLSEQERREIESHVNESVVRARDMDYNQPSILEIIEAHHELMNGTGYPRRAHGDEIPLGARITGVADVYCALTAWRPYREAWDKRVALSEIRKGVEAGKYDPKVVDALTKLMS